MRLPLSSDKELLDSEFADDIMLYVHYSIDSLREVLDMFYVLGMLVRLLPFPDGFVRDVWMLSLLVSITRLLEESLLVLLRLMMPFHGMKFFSAGT